MAEFARIGFEGWETGDDSTDQARIGIHGWYQVNGTGSPPTFLAAWAKQSNIIVIAENERAE